MDRRWNLFRKRERTGERESVELAHQLGGTLLRNMPPGYDRELSLEDNWRRFYEWALELRQPAVSIVEHGLEVKRHPIGFTAVYLTERAQGILTPGVRGVIRANIIDPRSNPLRDDIHSHGYRFTSGVVDGEVTNNLYPDILPLRRAEDEQEGYIGYETTPDHMGVNRVTKATVPVVVPQPEAHVLGVGDHYSMNPQYEFHSLSSNGGITLFGKTPSGALATMQHETQVRSLILRPADQPPPPPEY